MVLSTAENLHFQELGVQIWINYIQAKLPPLDPLRIIQDIFRRNQVVVERFGRFPHRNKLLGRESTSQEEDYLKDNMTRFDKPLIFNAEGSFERLGGDDEAENPWPDLDFSSKLESLQI